MYNLPYSYFAYFGTIYLIYLTWQDFKNNMFVDDRFNYLMMGITLSLFSHLKVKLTYVLGLYFVALTAVFLVWGFLMNKFKLVGRASIHSIIWVWLGFGIINVYYLIWFSAFFVILLTIYTLFKNLVLKIKHETPLYHIILIAFILACALFGIY